MDGLDKFRVEVKFKGKHIETYTYHAEDVCGVMEEFQYDVANHYLGHIGEEIVYVEISKEN